MADLILQRFDHDGIELIIDTQTGESFASIKGYARMSGKSSNAITMRLNRLSKENSKGVTSESPNRPQIQTGSGLQGGNTMGLGLGLLKQAQIQTEGGLQGVYLIPEDLICKWLPKDNPELASQVLKLGVRLFLHTLAGFRVKSEAITEVRQLESQIVKLSEEKQILEELIKTQKTMIADFSSKNSMLDYKRLVIEELHAEKERDIAKFNLLETEREKARGWRGGRMLMRNDKKR
jgi:hypothetical protein